MVRPVCVHPFLTLVAAVVAAPVAMSALPASAADCKAMAAASVDWQGCNKSSLVLGSSALDGALLAETDFSYTDLRSSTLTGANLEKAKLIRSSLAGSTVDKANLNRIEGYRTVFTGMSAKGATFVSGELQRADFTGSDLTGADFQKAELGRAKFEGATITGVRFSHANLSRAELEGAVFQGPLDFTGAFLFLTRLGGLDLSQATGLQQAQVEQACGTADTKLPQGLTAPAGWPCKFETD